MVREFRFRVLQTGGERGRDGRTDGGNGTGRRGFIRIQISEGLPLPGFALAQQGIHWVQLLTVKVCVEQRQR